MFFNLIKPSGFFTYHHVVHSQIIHGACFEESVGLYELKQYKPWFDEECPQFLD